MITFSLRNFREQLKTDLSSAEVRFMIRTFSLAALYFFGFMLLTLTAHFISRTLFNVGKFSDVGFAIWLITGFLFFIPFYFNSRKYRSNPLAASNGLVLRSYLFLTVSFLSLFMGVAWILSVLSENADSTKFVARTIFFIFGTTFFIYMIPAGLGLYINKKRTIMSLRKFLGFLYILNFAMMVVMFLIAIFALNVMAIRLGEILFFGLTALILLISPIITIYRMKTVVAFINHEDMVERGKWERYFAFEISVQLLELAFMVARMVLRVLAAGGRRG